MCHCLQVPLLRIPRSPETPLASCMAKAMLAIALVHKSCGWVGGVRRALETLQLARIKAASTKRALRDLLKFGSRITRLLVGSCLVCPGG